MTHSSLLYLSSSLTFLSLTWLGLAERERFPLLRDLFFLSSTCGVRLEQGAQDLVGLGGGEEGPGLSGVREGGA